MDRLSSRFFEHMPEAFMDPLSQSSSLQGEECQNLSQFSHLPPRHFKLGGQPKRPATATGSWASKKSFSSTTTKSSAWLIVGTEDGPPYRDSFATSPEDDVFTQRAPPRNCPSKLLSPNAIKKPAPEGTGSLSSKLYDTQLNQFTKIFEYGLGKPIPEQWASKLGIWEWQWAERIDESEEQMYFSALGKEEQFREAQLETGKVLMALWRQQARLNIRQMSAEASPKRQNSFARLVQSDKADPLRRSRLVQQMRRAADLLKTARPGWSPGQRKPKTVLAISYSSTTRGLQPRMVPSFLPSPRLDAEPNLLSGARPIGRRPWLTTRDTLSDSSSSSPITTPTKKPAPSPVSMAAIASRPGELRQKHRQPQQKQQQQPPPPLPPPPRFMMQTQQSRARARPDPPRAEATRPASILAKMAKSLRRPPPHPPQATLPRAKAAKQTLTTAAAAAKTDARLRHARETERAKRSSCTVAACGLAASSAAGRAPSWASFASDSRPASRDTLAAMKRDAPRAVGAVGGGVGLRSVIAEMPGPDKLSGGAAAAEEEAKALPATPDDAGAEKVGRAREEEEGRRRRLRLPGRTHFRHGCEVGEVEDDVEEGAGLKRVCGTRDLKAELALTDKPLPPLPRLMEGPERALSVSDAEGERF